MPGDTPEPPETAFMARHRLTHAALVAVLVILLFGLGTLLSPWRPAAAPATLSGFGALLSSALLVLAGSRIGSLLTARHRQARSAEIDAALDARDRSLGPPRIRLQPELRYRTVLALCAAAIVSGYALFGVWSLLAAPPLVWLHGVAIGALGTAVSGRPLLHGVLRMLRPTIVEVSRDGLMLVGPRSVAVAWDEIDRILLERSNGGLVLRFRLVDIAGTLARLAPFDRRLLEAEWRSGHPPISINLNALDGSVGKQLQAITRLMPPHLPALDIGGPSGAYGGASR